GLISSQRSRSSTASACADLDQPELSSSSFLSTSDQLKNEWTLACEAFPHAAAAACCFSGGDCQPEWVSLRSLALDFSHRAEIDVVIAGGGTISISGVPSKLKSSGFGGRYGATVKLKAAEPGR